MTSDTEFKVQPPGVTESGLPVTNAARTSQPAATSFPLIDAVFSKRLAGGTAAFLKQHVSKSSSSPPAPNLVHPLFAPCQPSI